MRKLYLASFDFTREGNTEPPDTPLWDFRLVVVTEKDVEIVRQKYPEWVRVLQARDTDKTIESDTAYVIAAQWFKKRYPDGNATHVSVKPAIEGPIDDTDVSCQFSVKDELQSPTTPLDESLLLDH